MPNMQSAYRRDRGDEDGQQSAACGRQRTDVSSLSAWPNCRLWHRRPRAVDKPAWATVRVAWRGVVVVPVVSVWQNIPCRVQRQHVVHHPRRLLSAASAKTEVMWLGSGQQINQVDVSDILILSSSVKVVESARPGPWRHYWQSVVAVVTRCCALSAVGPDFTTWSSYIHSVGHYQQKHQSTKTLVQASISCRLDYCNSLLYGVTNKLMRQVQSAQNAAARLITEAKRHEHITPILRQLHWLPVRRRVEFKIASLIYQLPSAVKQSTYLSGWRYSSRLGKFWSLPQVLFGKKVLCHSCLQMFCCSWTTYWNNLPASLRDKEVSCTEFRRQLEIFMSQTDSFTYLLNQRCAQI